MRAILTSDLFNKGNERLVITTCADMLRELPDITDFILSRGIPAKLTSDFHNAKLVLTGPPLMENIHDIQLFIEMRMNK